MRLSWTAFWSAVLLLLASLVYCRAFIDPFVRDGTWTAHYNPVAFASTGEWGADHVLITGHDWDVHYSYQTAVQRSVVHDRQWPFWNPWVKGGASLWGNPEVQFPTPMWLVNLVAGPIGGARLQVILHHWIGLLGAFWLARLVGYSVRAAILASCTFMMSTWYSLHLAAGHASFWSAAYMPIALGCLWLARSDLRWALGGAACLALVIFEGGTYVYLIFLVLAVSLTLAWAVEFRSWRPLAALMLTISFSVGLAAVRLAPQTALLERYPRSTEAVRGSYDQLTKDLTETQSPDSGPGSLQDAPGEPTMRMTGLHALVGQLWRIFLGRVQQVGKFYYRYQGYGWHEYGAYIGPVAVLLMCLGPAAMWRRRPLPWSWYVGGAVCFLLALGNFTDLSPWALLHELPFYGNTRVPSRYLIPTVLCIAMAAAAGYDALWQRFAEHSRRRRVLFEIALILACADLALVGGRAFDNRAEHIRVAVPPRPATVTTVIADPHQQTALMMAGYRARNGYDAIPVLSHAAAVGDPGYRGELYLEVPSGTSTEPPGSGGVGGVDHTWTPGRLTLDVPALDEGWAVWNINWAPGWRSDPPGLVQSREGLLAVKLEGYTGPVTLYYIPERLEIGLGISAIALGAAIAWLVLAGSRPLTRARASRPELRGVAGTRTRP